MAEILKQVQDYPDGSERTLKREKNDLLPKDQVLTSHKHVRLSSSSTMDLRTIWTVWAKVKDA